VKETGSPQRQLPGLQIVIVQRDRGMIEHTMGPTPLIEPDPLDERMPELEPPGR
jgi:hypothetical protein